MSRRKQTAIAASGQPKPSPIQPPAKQAAPEPPLMAVSSVSVSAYSGPMPPPTLLRDYDEVVPGAAKLIVEQFIKQGEHRMQLEQAKVYADIQHARLGMGAAFVISLCAFGVSAWAIACDLSWVAVAVVGADLAALTGAFLTGKYINKAEREKRMDRTAKPAQSSESQNEPRR